MLQLLLCIHRGDIRQMTSVMEVSLKDAMRKSHTLLGRLTKIVIIPIPKGIPDRIGTIQWIPSDAVQANLTPVSRSLL